MTRSMRGWVVAKERLHRVHGLSDFHQRSNEVRMSIDDWEGEAEVTHGQRLRVKGERLWPFAWRDVQHVMDVDDAAMLVQRLTKAEKQELQLLVDKLRELQSCEREAVQHFAKSMGLPQRFSPHLKIHYVDWEDSSSLEQRDDLLIGCIEPELTRLCEINPEAVSFMNAQGAKLILCRK